MIKLPDDFLDSAYVDTSKRCVILHFKNGADEYFTYRYALDKAFTFDQHMQRLRELDFSSERAYSLGPDLTTSFFEPIRQDWYPAPYPADHIMSLAQYRAHMEVSAKEESSHAN